MSYFLVEIELLSKEIVDVWMLMVKENSSDLIKKAGRFLVFRLILPEYLMRFFLLGVTLV